MSLAAGGMLVLLALVAALSGVLATYRFDVQNLSATFAPPSGAHLLGTDNLGRDLYSRLIYGLRISYEIGLAATGVEVVVGCLLGAIAGYYGGWADSLIMRLADLLFAFPPLLIAILMAAVLGPSLPNIVLAISIGSWPGMARTVRAEVLTLRDAEFILAARVIGVSGARTVLRHLLPNTLHLVAVRGTLGVGVAILAEATLSFLGLGIQPPTPSLGSMISEGYRYLRSQSTMLVEPAILLSLLVIAFNMAGEGLADALDPARRTADNH